MTSAESIVPSPHLAPAHDLRSYRGKAGHWDEAVTAEGTVRPHWQRFADAVDSQTRAEAQSRHDLCRRILRESGVTYTPPDRELQDERPWQLDAWPLLIAPAEWQALSSAVSQRARLLNLVLADIYGPGKLLRTGDLPPEIVFANPAFVRAAHGMQPPGGIYLQTYAVDVARSPDGRWWVVGDRTDTPAGAGYALENRIVLGRVYPELIRDCRVQRLARFFQQLRDGLLAQAAVRNRDPRVVIYTPGPFHSTYFEQAYLARYLGFNLVEGRDLTVRDQGVFLKTLSGLLPVDVILRRVNSDYCDPLELRGDSLLGVPGLLQVARAGNVVIANAIGAGVTETPALLPFLPTLCRRLLDEDLLLPPVATWWCGQEKALEVVVGQLDRLVVKHAYANHDSPGFLPGQVPKAEMIAMLRANPHLYLGQECVALSTAPVWQDQHLEPRQVMVRLYAFALSADEYVVMPGGLTRAEDSSESMLPDAKTGGGSKDTWVLSHSTPDTTTLLPTHKQTSDLSRAGFILPSRLADDLYWLGRYVERIEFGCRLARCLLHRITNESELGHPDELVYLVDLLVTQSRLPANSAARSELRLEGALELAVFDDENTGSIAGDIAKMHRIASGVRDRLSLDAWRILTQLGNDFVPTKQSGLKTADAQLAAMDLVLGRLSSFSGQMADGMTRDKGWLFLEIGRRLERVTDLSQLILHGFSRPDANENSRLLALLEIANSAMTYQSRYVFGPDPVRVLDLLIADESNPRSIAFQLAALYQHVRGLRVGQGSQLASEELNLIMTVFSDVRLLDVEAIVQVNRKGRRTRLISRLTQLIRAMNELSNLLTRTHLIHVQAARPLGGAKG
jgi:uncharacterized circularly permuted ATP-grasp superfamily protein/uncharacterized alpha-E superfamily protein